MPIGPNYGGVGIPKMRHIPMQVPRYFSVPRNRRSCKGSLIDPNVMFPAVMVENTAVFAQVSFEVAPIHGIRQPDIRDSFLNSLTRDCRNARRASRALANASETVSASVMSSGSSGEVTTYPPSSASVSCSTNFPSLTV